MFEKKLFNNTQNCSSVALTLTISMKYIVRMIWKPGWLNKHYFEENYSAIGSWITGPCSSLFPPYWDNSRNIVPLFPSVNLDRKQRCTLGGKLFFHVGHSLDQACTDAVCIPSGRYRGSPLMVIVSCRWFSHFHEFPGDPLKTNCFAFSSAIRINKSRFCSEMFPGRYIFRTCGQWIPN